MGTFKKRIQIFIHFEIVKTIPESTFQKYVSFSNMCVYSEFKTFQNNYLNCWEEMQSQWPLNRGKKGNILYRLIILG